MNFPDVTPVTEFTLSQFPQQVNIYEVGPRDGLQNESQFVATQEKAAFITELIRSGLPIVELTSFVSPKWVPQLADASELLAMLPSEIAQSMPVLVPNMKGLSAAIESKVNHIAIFASATEAFAKNNLNTSYEGQFEPMSQVAVHAHEAGMKIRGYVSMCFGDPWEGHVAQDKVVDTVIRLLDLGVYEVSLGDTIGVATPGQVQSVIHKLTNRGVDVNNLAVHFHDTYGQALSNSLMAIACGVTTVDASAGGLGGCPYAPNAAGNLATEDLIWMLHGMGISTGVNLDVVMNASSRITQLLNRPTSSRVLKALSGK